MSDIQEEQKRLYKRAEENDKEMKRQYKISEEYHKENRKLLKEIHNREINELQDRINKAIEYIEQILKFIISKNIKEEKREYERLEHIVNILKGDNK